MVSFHFFCSSPWEDLVSPWRPNFRRRGSWRLIVRRGMCFVPAPFSILSLSYPETVGKSSRKRKIFRLCRFIGQAESSLPGSYDSGCPRHRARNLSGVVCRDYRSGAASFSASPTTTDSHAIAGMFMSIFEGELRDPRFIELAQAFRYHAVVLFRGRTRER
jgi:hypothetical protein